MNVLIVDDDDACLQAITLMLKKSGAIIAKAKSGLEARAMACSQNFDLILTDIGLPDVDGFELVNFFCSLKPSVAVVVLSGHILQSSEQVLNQMGVMQLLEKPIYAKKIQEIIEKISHQPLST